MNFSLGGSNLIDHWKRKTPIYEGSEMMRRAHDTAMGFLGKTTVWEFGRRLDPNMKAQICKLPVSANDFALSLVAFVPPIHLKARRRLCGNDRLSRIPPSASLTAVLE